MMVEPADANGGEDKPFILGGWKSVRLILTAVMGQDDSQG